MIFGFITIDPAEGAIHTHHDTYLLRDISVVSVRRPFLAGASLFGGGLAAFSARFADLLYPAEFVALALTGAGIVLAGFQVGQLSLLSRDLRGSELSGAVWGRYAALNAKRRAIALTITAMRKGAGA